MIDSDETLAWFFKDKIWFCKTLRASSAMSRRDLDIRVSSADELEIFSDFMALSATASLPAEEAGLLVFLLSSGNTES